MKLFYFIALLFLFSCNSVKIKELKMDSTQDLIGTIKEIKVTTFQYSHNNEDTPTNSSNSVVFFDSKNKIIKQIDIYSKFSDETIFNYKNDLLESTITKSGNNTTKIEFTYDSKKNIIEYKQLENDSLFFSRTTLYDQRNNPTEKIYLRPKNKTIKSFEKFETDYKTRTVKIISLDENYKTSNQYLNRYFDKKGYIIKTEFINSSTKNGNASYSIMDYDKKGNLIRSTNYTNDKVTNSYIYKNTYDKKGNIILREKYFDEKLFEKITFEITYL